MLNYLLNVGEVKQTEAFVDVIRAGLSSEAGDKIVTTVAEYLRQQGREQGVQQGVQVGESLMLLRLLEGKFGTLSPIYQDRIQKADSEQLLQWGEKLFEVASIDQLFIN